MTRLNYRTKAKAAGGDATFSEFAGPLALLVVGLLSYGAGAFFMAGARTAGVVMGIIFVIAVVETIVGIAVAYVTAAVLGTSFGELRTAVLKLAGILVFSGAIAFILPLGGLISLAIYFGLLMWFFGLEVYEAVIFAILFSLARVLVVLGIGGMFA